MTKVKKTLAVCLSVVLVSSSAPPREAEASWFSDLCGGLFTVFTTPIWVFCPDNPTFRKNNPFRKKAWEENNDIYILTEDKEERVYRKLFRELRKEQEEKDKKRAEEKEWERKEKERVEEEERSLRRMKKHNSCVPSDMPVDFKGTIRDWIILGREIAQQEARIDQQNENRNKELREKLARKSKKCSQLYHKDGSVEQQLAYWKAKVKLNKTAKEIAELEKNEEKIKNIQKDLEFARQEIDKWQKEREELSNDSKGSVTNGTGATGKFTVPKLEPSPPPRPNEGTT
jgi:hypothetical protein